MQDKRKKANIVEINGRRYDVTTGAPIEDVSTTPQVIHPTRTVDGIRRRTPAHDPNRTTPKNTAHSVHQKQKRSITLNRTTTQKPVGGPRQPINAKVAAPHSPQSSSPAPSPLQKHQLTQQVDPSRMQRATSTQRSNVISKFGSSAPMPASEPTNETPTPVAPTPPIEPTLPPTPTQAPQELSPKEQLIRAGMAAVGDDTDELPSEPRGLKAFFARRPKPTAIAAMVLSAVILTGYITYLNVPNMALRVAASRAGFEASMPGYKPSGYAFAGPIEYTPGLITIKYDSNSDDRAFTITERTSSWDSQALLDNFVEKQSDRYITYQERGLTVFVYDGSNASWVNGGVWYTIEGDSLLSSDQLVRIASSM